MMEYCQQIEQGKKTEKVKMKPLLVVAGVVTYIHKNNQNKIIQQYQRNHFLLIYLSFNILLSTYQLNTIKQNKNKQKTTKKKKKKR